MTEGTPTARDPAPRFTLSIYGKGAGLNLGDTQGDILAQHTRTLDFEQSINQPSRLEMIIDNPSNLYTDSALLAPGNIIEVWAGYGRTLQLLGAAELVRPRFQFGQDTPPTIRILGYDRTFRMADQQSVKKPKSITPTAKERREAEEPEGIAWVDMTDSDIVRVLCSKWKMDADIAPTKSITTRLQFWGTSDLELVRGLAGYHGYQWFTTYEPRTRRFMLHWGLRQQAQDKMYVFRHSTGEDATLLEFECDYTIQDAATIVEVLSYDPLSAEELNEVKRETEAGTFGEEITSGTRVRLAIGDHAISVIATVPFATAAEVQEFAEHWAQQKRERFLTGRGRVLGVETLCAQQTHVFEGIGKQFSGEWFFRSVSHRFERDNGYFCDFEANKELKETSSLPRSTGLIRKLANQ